jgi:UDP-3-O-[3-hydroxymyristoyl] glucosamine N-acyltransferase
MLTLQQLAVALGAELIGDGAVYIERVTSVSQADGHSLVFAENPAALHTALVSAAGAVLARDAASPGKPILRVRNPRLAFALAARLLQPTNPVDAATRIHPSAVIGEGAVIAESCCIDAACVVGEGVTLGHGTHLYPRVVLYPGTVVGERVIVHAGAVLGADGFGYVPDPATGEYTQFPQQGMLVIEDDVEIGANTTIDRGALEETRIGRGTKIDNLVHIGHNVRIGRNVVIAAQTGISGSCVIGDGAVLGGQVGMGDHAEIGPGVIVGGGAGILPHKKLLGPGKLFWGKPARPVQQHLREQATLARLARRSASTQAQNELEQEDEA